MNFSTVPQSHSESQWWAENHPGIRAAGQVIGRPLCVEREAAPVTLRTKRPGLGKWVLAQDVRIWSLHWVHPSREHPFQKKHWATEWTGWVSQLMCASLCPEPPQGLHMGSRREKPQWQRWKLTTGPESRASSPGVKATAPAGMSCTLGKKPVLSPKKVPCSEETKQLHVGKLIRLDPFHLGKCSALPRLGLTRIHI